MKKKKDLDTPQKVRTTLEELEVLERMKDSTEWAIFKRLAARYVGNLRRASFKLMETDPHYLSVRHAEFAGQALGIRQLINMVDNAGRKKSKLKERK